MTLGKRITILVILTALQACSIQGDVPGFVYPETTVTGSANDAPALQPTSALIADSDEELDTYSQTIQLLDDRAYRLRQALVRQATS